MTVEDRSTEELLDDALAILTELSSRYDSERMFAKILDKRDIANVVRNFQGWRSHV